MGTAKKTTDIFIKEVYDLVGLEYKVIGDYINNKEHIKMQHIKCGHKWNVIPVKFVGKEQTRCPNCNKSGSHKRRKDPKDFLDEIYTLVKDDYTIISEYITKKIKISIKHNVCIDGKTHIYEVAPTRFLTGDRCPRCSKLKTSSKGELLIDKILNLYGYKYTKNKDNHFEGCISKRGNYLDFDFYLNDLNLLIEFDGSQHFLPKMNKGIEYERCIENDQYRNSWVLENDISFLRIPYNTSEEDIDLIIKNITSEKSIIDLSNKLNLYFVNQNSSAVINLRKYYENINKDYFKL